MVRLDTPRARRVLWWTLLISVLLAATGPKAGGKDHISGDYTLSAGHLKIFYSHEPGEWTEVDVTRKADGSLTFSHVHDGGNAQAQAMSEAWFTTWKRTSA